MIITANVKKYIHQSVLCWLATVSNDGMPNVSPKEVFAHYQGDQIIVANIASPQTLKNLKYNNQVCISFIDILVQKGYQIKGTAEICHKDHTSFSRMEKLLLPLTGGLFPFSSITLISAQKVKAIIAPRYILFPDTTEAQQIESAKKIYGI